MRYVLAVLLLLPVLATCPAQDKEAERLFHELERKIVAAKSFEVAFDYNVEKRKVKGSLLLTHDGKARVKSRGDFGGGGPDSTFVAVSDGKQLVTKGWFSGDKRIAEKTPKNFHAVFATMQCRGGVWMSLLVLPGLLGEEKELTVEQMRIKVYDFKLDAEKVGGRDTKMIRYRLGEGGMCPDDAEVILWIDDKTRLPLKRRVVTKREVVRVTEIYSEFQLDPKVDAKAFELPR